MNVDFIQSLGLVVLGLGCMCFGVSLLIINMRISRIERRLK